METVPMAEFAGPDVGMEELFAGLYEAPAAEEE